MAFIQLLEGQNCGFPFKFEFFLSFPSLLFPLNPIKITRKIISLSPVQLFTHSFIFFSFMLFSKNRTKIAGRWWWIELRAKNLTRTINQPLIAKGKYYVTRSHWALLKAQWMQAILIRTAREKPFLKMLQMGWCHPHISSYTWIQHLSWNHFQDLQSAAGFFKKKFPVRKEQLTVRWR